MTARVEPEWAMVTVVFVDIRGFTTFADRSTAREAVDHLNGFFGLAVPAVERLGGSVNKLLGDGLLAVFSMPDHADRSPRSTAATGSASASTQAWCSWERSAAAATAKSG
jgi:adenylate cyclase